MEPIVSANASQIQRLLSVAVLCPESMTDVREGMLLGNFKTTILGKL
ncbi:hypothetical protein SAMN04489735_102548 [Aneurinibacillus thermoaerophilus]|uniref:Uncharacterized protein n=1 Tax=Aneurinibacillus thermoaerophilus TaxID=143495 RepID=A0A1G8CGZ8_ANETH|nr:hypothetical protein [Aneurinibacillus thermoaerophilus]SDH44727.1 hypothetical protein SAMN04489735_102548 [Aneurinibacillus thermoaerophilus]